MDRKGWIILFLCGLALAANMYLAGQSRKEQQEAIDTWKGIKSDANPTDEDMQEEIDGMRGNYFEIIGTISGFNIWVQSRGLYEFLFFDFQFESRFF